MNNKALTKWYQLEKIRRKAKAVIDLVETQPDFSGWPLLTQSDYTEFYELKEALEEESNGAGDPHEAPPKTQNQHSTYSSD